MGKAAAADQVENGNEKSERRVAAAASDEEEEERRGQQQQQPPLMALNHVSRLCKSVTESAEFYTDVLGFVPMERPEAFESFDGAWLFNYGVGIHLVEDKHHHLPDDAQQHHLDPMDNHISFQCEDMEAVEQKLKQKGIKYIKRTVDDDENGATIDQVFFNDPNGFMIEICNCENLKLVPTRSVGNIQLPSDRHNPPVELNGDS